MKEEKLVRCRPCGYIMKESELGAVCPACGLPHTVFEPYREKVSSGRLRFLALDLHPIAIHLSQTFVAMIPGLIILNFIFPNFFPETLRSVITFSVIVFPLTLLASIVTGIADGYTRFKTMDTPLLKQKIVYSVVILTLSALQIFFFKENVYTWYFFLTSLVSLVCAVKLGRLGVHLINVILPGTLILRKKIESSASKAAPKKMSPEEIERLKAERLAAKQKEAE